MVRIVLIILLILVILCGLGVITIRPTLPTEIFPSNEEGETPASEAATSASQPTPTPTRIRPKVFLEGLSTGPAVVVEGERAFIANENGEFVLDGNGQPIQTRRLPRHGLLIAFVLPLLLFGIPWVILELFIVRYVQPRGADLSTVLVKAQDGLFVEAVVSMTARRTLTLAASRMTWPRVRDLVEKTVEQELIHEAISFASLQELEQNLKAITERLRDLPIVQELSRDFGLEVLRFNIEIRYTPQTREALQRKAEASAGGTAYLAYAAAAHLDPDRPESRELYRIFQETSSQVDAARNLGGGIGAIASLLRPREQDTTEDDSSSE